MSKINKLEECVLNDTSPLVTMSNELDNNEMYYNCSECPSMIEILSLEEDNNFIEFKCLNTDNEHNNHGKIKMLLKDYLESMKTHNNKVINDDTCYIHNNSKFISYCISCCKHL